MLIKIEIQLFILLIFVILIIIMLNKENFEENLIRYIKLNRKNIKIIDYKKKLKSIIKYVKILKKKNNKIEAYYKELIIPKISFISTTYNQEKYLSTFIYSIQRQNLKEYELIFIDDYSNDNSTKIIKNIQKKDIRVKLIKNKKNMGTLYSRYIGQLNSKSDYIIFVDCDDIILKEGIFNSYHYIIKYNLDIIQFHTVWQKKNIIYINSFSYKYKKIIYKPILSYIFYYNIYKGAELNYALWDKLVKKNIANKAFKWIGEKYLKNNIIIHNDLIVLFSLFQFAYSYQYINEIGYYYIKTNENSATNSWRNPKKIIKIIHSLFTNINFLYEKTNNSILCKNFCVYKVLHYFKRYNSIFKYINDEEYYYIKNILTKLINSNYISINNKLKILKIDGLIRNMKDKYTIKL